MQFNSPHILYIYPTVEWIAEQILIQFPDKSLSHFEKKLFRWVHIRVYVRTKLGEAQNWRCCWCGCRMNWTIADEHPTLEHIIPKSQGGDDTDDNLAIACSLCNNKRGTKSIEQYMEEIAGQNRRFIKNLIAREKGLKAQKRVLRKQAVKKYGTTKYETWLAIVAIQGSDMNPFDEESPQYLAFERMKKDKYSGKQLSPRYMKILGLQTN